MSYWHAFKKIFIKIGVLCSHFNNEDRRREAMFLAYYALLFQERYVVEIKTKVWVAYGERTVTDLSEMVCEVSCWRLLTGRCSWSSRPVEVESNQTETLRTISVIPCGRRLTYSKCPSQVLKIICLYFLISLNNLQCWKKKNHLHQLGYVIALFGFHISCGKTSLTIFLHVILYRNIMKLFCF